MNEKIERIWERTRALRPIIEAHRAEGDGLHRLPDAIARAFAEANVYRLLLPKEFGGEELDPITYYDVVEEISSYDGSVGWNFSIRIEHAHHSRRSVTSQTACDLCESRFVRRRLRLGAGAVRSRSTAATASRVASPGPAASTK